MRGRHRNRAAREAERGLDQARPGQSAVLVPERVEPGRNARHPARADADRVVHELRAERNVQLQREPPLAARRRARGRRRSSRGSARGPWPRRSRSRAHLRGGPSSPSRRRTRRGSRRPRRRPRSRRPRGSPRPPPQSQDGRQRLRALHGRKSKGPPAATAPHYYLPTRRAVRAAEFASPVPILGECVPPRSYACILLLVLVAAGCGGSKKQSVFDTAGKCPPVASAASAGNAQIDAKALGGRYAKLIVIQAKDKSNGAPVHGGNVTIHADDDVPGLDARCTRRSCRRPRRAPTRPAIRWSCPASGPSTSSSATRTATPRPRRSPSRSRPRAPSCYPRSRPQSRPCAALPAAGLECGLAT